MITTQVNKYSKFKRAIQRGRPFYLGEIKMRKLTEKQIEARRMPAGEVIARLSDHARGSMSEFLVFDADGEARIDLAKAKRAHRLQLIRRLRLGENSVEVDLYDAQEALIQLGRHHRLFVDRVQNEDWRARAIEDIKAGRVTYEALVNAFDESLAQELFQEAEKQVAVSKS